MKTHRLKVYASRQHLPKEEQLAYRLAQTALDEAPLSPSAREMAINRIIDNAAVALASLHRDPVVHARDQALAHPVQEGSCIFGLHNKYRFSAEWAGWANGVAVRELDFHDTFLAEDYAHPADNIPPLLAVAQQTKKSGKDLLKGILAAYEIHISLVKGICLHKHKIDHIAHLCPAPNRRPWCFIEYECGKAVSSHPTGCPCFFHDPPVPQGGDFQLESLCSRLGRQNGH